MKTLKASMQLLILLGTLLASLVSPAAKQQVVMIDVKGMTCSYCVYGVTKNLKKLPAVQDVQVSLKLKKARIVMRPGKSADIDKIKQDL